MLKAADAATLGPGLPPSAFALARPALLEATSAVSLALICARCHLERHHHRRHHEQGMSPKFSGASLRSSTRSIFDNGTGRSRNRHHHTYCHAKRPRVRSSTGTRPSTEFSLLLPATGTATAAKGFNSQLFKIYTSAFNSSSNAVVVPRFEWQGEVTGK